MVCGTVGGNQQLSNAIQPSVLLFVLNTMEAAILRLTRVFVDLQFYDQSSAL